MVSVWVEQQQQNTHPTPDMGILRVGNHKKETLFPAMALG
jgi:hypothetical protein